MKKTYLLCVRVQNGVHECFVAKCVFRHHRPENHMIKRRDYLFYDCLETRACFVELQASRTKKSYLFGKWGQLACWCAVNSLQNRNFRLDNQRFYISSWQFTGLSTMRADLTSLWPARENIESFHHIVLIKSFKDFKYGNQLVVRLTQFPRANP